MQIIKKIKIRYFRSIYTMTLDGCSSLNIISGRNDSGKSNVLRSINLFFNEETDWNSKIEFYHDFSVHRLDEVRKQSIKGKQFISIEIEFLRPHSYAGSLPPIFSVNRTWFRDSKQYQESSNLEALGKSGKLPSSLVTARRGLQTFLNKIHYEHVPAIKDRAYSQHLLSRLQKALLDSTLDDGTGIPQLATNLATTIQKQVDELQVDFLAATGLATVFEPPKQLSELFQAFHVVTSNSTDQTIPLSSRGDGIQARYLSSVLNYIAEKSNKFFVWGFEEPENSLEFRSAEDLAVDFLKRYSKKSQIFVTTHSPAFVSISTADASCFRAFQEKQKTVLINLANSENGKGHQQELNHELGILKIQQEIHDFYAARLQELKAVENARTQAELELSVWKKSLLLVEGKTDKRIIEIAWTKLKGTAIPFRVRVADPAADGSTGGTGMLARTIEGVHPDDGRCCVALFDRDEEGIKGYDSLSKNFVSVKNMDGLKIHTNKVSYGMLLPVPDFRKEYAIAKNHMIEFMFADDVLEKKVDGFGLQFKKPVAALVVNGKTIQDSAQYLSSGVNLDLSPYRKIHNGKDHFAESIVPSLGEHDFAEFDRLFSILHSIKGFFDSNPDTFSPITSSVDSSDSEELNEI